jgi:putative glycosyltransferase
MIFVTVGTHEQQFNRLIEEIDKLKEEEIITSDVFIQVGFSDYRPRFCEWKQFLSYDEMNSLMKKSDTIITHGGPATFMNVIANGKKPVVVPRRKKFGEHVNDHQLDFCKRIVQEGYDLVVIEDIKEIREHLIPSRSATIKSNNERFVKQFSNLIAELVE